MHMTLGKFKCIYVMHEYREANLMVDSFANEAIKK